MRTTLLSLAALLAGLATLVGCATDRPSLNEGSRFVRTIEKRQAAAEQELAALSDGSSLPPGHWAREWAGEYSSVPTGVSFYLAPETGAVYTFSACRGLHDANHGRIVEVLPDGLRLDLAVPSDRHSFLSERMYFVRRGERRYLVAETRMLDLVNRCNESGFALEDLPFLPLRVEDHDLPARGRPELPTRWARLLREEPVRAPVLALEAVRHHRYVANVEGVTAVATLGAGSAEGVYPGMRFRFGKPDEAGIIEVVRVEEHTSTGDLSAAVRPGNPPALPKVGENVSIRWGWGPGAD